MEIHVFLAATTLGHHTQGPEGRELVDHGTICAQEIQCAFTKRCWKICSYGVKTMIYGYYMVNDG